MNYSNRLDPDLSQYGKGGLKSKRGWGRAPSTVANVGAGFDLLGFALNKKADEVDLILHEVSDPSKRGIKSLKVEGDSSGLIPLDPSQNVTTVALNSFIHQLDLNIACDVILKKGIPVSSGLGGSAASAVVGVVALNACLNHPCGLLNLLPATLVGEALASGAPHADNVAPCLWGGLILSLPESDPTLESKKDQLSANPNHLPHITQIPIVDEVAVLMAHPKWHITTREARSVLESTLPLRDHTHQMAHLAGFLTGCFQNDRSLLKRHLRDVVIAPQRASLLPGFLETQAYLKEKGVFGCEISGAGPSLFALCNQEDVPVLAEQLSAFFGRFHSVEVWSEQWGAPGAIGRALEV